MRGQTAQSAYNAGSLAAKIIVASFRRNLTVQHDTDGHAGSRKLTQHANQAIKLCRMLTEFEPSVLNMISLRCSHRDPVADDALAATFYSAYLCATVFRRVNSGSLSPCHFVTSQITFRYHHSAASFLIVLLHNSVQLGKIATACQWPCNVLLARNHVNVCTLACGFTGLQHISHIVSIPRCYSAYQG